MAGLKSTLTPGLLADIREFWFGHVENEDCLIAPGQDELKPWFFGGEEFDQHCVGRFADVLEAVRKSGVSSAKEIIEAAQPQSPLDWMSLVIFLDQMPRNCYRNEQATIAFNFFDPLARGVTAEAIARGIPDKDPQIRWYICRRMWFYLPMMHSEELSTHEQAMAAYEAMAKDIDLLAAGSVDVQDEHQARAVKAVAGKRDETRSMAEKQILFEKKHLDIIKEFGRYPHRNKALSREPTQAEIKYLAEGGETFGGAQKKAEGA